MGGRKWQLATMASHLAQQRLKEERSHWKKNHPHGFVAKPSTRKDGSLDLMKWDCLIPGKADTIWEGGRYPVTLEFSSNYPDKAPVARFPQGFFHLNVYPDGHVCLSILNDDPDLGGEWRPSISVPQILLGIQNLLDEENAHSPAQARAFEVYRNSKAEYNRLVSAQARKYAE